MSHCRVVSLPRRGCLLESQLPAKSVVGSASSFGSTRIGMDCASLFLRRAKIWQIFRKFYIFVTVINAVALLLAALDVWHYPRQYTGAFVLGNLLFAILMRNELFGRILYAVVNFLFAKVRSPSSSLAEANGSHSGHHCGSDWVARRHCSTSAASTLAARRQVSCGSSLG